MCFKCLAFMACLTFQKLEVHTDPTTKLRIELTNAMGTNPLFVVTFF